MHKNSNSSNAWQKAYDLFWHTLMPKLRTQGKAIGEATSKGNETARNIIKTYTLLQRSFDPLNTIILEKEIAKYEQELQSPKSGVI